MSDSLQTKNSTEVRLQRLLQRFALAAKAHNSAMEAMDAERAEAQGRMLAGLHEALVCSEADGVEKLLELTESSDPVVAGMAAVYSIRHDSRRALAALIKIAKEPGLLGYRAGMAIERWESGEWDK
ncbi:MAG: hypothetical protein HXX17_04600 [Geobacteraceae bacterium]|nr:hypothetical protein [Geobacteraceae bacterium]